MSDIGNDFTVPCIINGNHFRMVVDTGAPFTNANRDQLLDKAQVPTRRARIDGGLIGTRAQESELREFARPANRRLHGARTFIS